MTGDGFVMYNRFVVLMADESEVGVSGCSMDASVHFIKGLAAEFNTNFLTDGILLIWKTKKC